MKWIAFLFMLMVLTACQSASTTGEEVAVSGGSYRNINSAELHEMLKGKDFVLVNVHIPFAGDIPNTDLSIPYDEIEQNLAELPVDKDDKIVLYCRSGRMSQIAAETFIGLGYTNVWNLKGGMVDWEQAGYILEK